ncbi:hypothetical protein PQJ75_22000 [Rhodoplanes sp. TEM]|uniref:Methyltransferase FkbM domain-containing protein n=1 Tax=Rhodoplanes tepidamans TaxID=200616 RepID=A0ABT5J6E8_RHOTP|nr:MULTISPECIES: hypothetical protein [Rhodoplanes]MDC7785237.1 hypothetical protein [Rhodoplanes tepidamans]MDC7986411.1 hypothetical protein [Rhodoplanes sp. TEM]MDQ0353495.1 putative O-methyltransferase YrrM [Rhodoplanes tepidamans]
MRHETWTTIEASPLAMRLFRGYHGLPDPVRAVLRWIAMPRWQAAAAYVHVRSGGRVLSGPFEGTQLGLSPISKRKLIGYVLGTQECELHDLVESLVARRYERIVNVGAADGYYSIGFARRLSEATVVAFEMLHEHHAGMLRAAEENGVADRFRVEGRCDAEALRRELDASPTRTLLVVDIEGGERELLDPEVVPGLRRADLLVETHDALVPGCTRALIDRFEATHDIERVAARPRTLANFPRDALPLLPRYLPGTAVELMNERRTGVQEWLQLTARATA